MASSSPHLMARRGLRAARPRSDGWTVGWLPYMSRCRSQIFADAATTAAVLAFEVGASQRDVRVRKIKRTQDLRGLRGGKRFSREKLHTTRRWSSLLEPRVSVPREFVPLGAFCRVHRGTVTGANSTWVTAHGDPRLPESVLVPTVTRAAELFNLESGVLADSSSLRLWSIYQRT